MNLQRMAEQPGQPFGHGQAKTEALSTVTGAITDLVKRLEEMWHVLGSDADTGVPHFQKYRIFPRARGDQHTTAFRVVERVGEQAAHDALQMPGIADDPGVGRGKTQLQIATDRQFAELGVNFNQQVTDRNCAWVCNRGAGIQLRYVQQFTQQSLQRRCAVLNA